MAAYYKVNSVQEDCAKCFAVHILKFAILQITWNKEYQTLGFQIFKNKSSILILFVLFFDVVCKISNFNKWTAKHLVKASSTELTLNIKLLVFGSFCRLQLHASALLYFSWKCIAPAHILKFILLLKILKLIKVNFFMGFFMLPKYCAHL